ncbi:CLUMA_CG008559, isoform A [Clunio marinus]|uniref:CLUMA_CG008559, isoform A n=1 Tax=Clunio marinus TaxID=568069 RepID=A0A1J1I9H2_9DIPT|nr:CLUMA_CG008559, isoform A [Clunio marinus]
MFCEKFPNKLQDQSVLIDIGCGDGATLASIINEFPIKFKRILGLDISEEMLKFARETYSNEVLKFRQLDMNEMESLSNEMLNQRIGINYESADIVTSFFCLHWFEDLKKTFGSIEKLIKPGGFLVINFLINVKAMSEGYIEVSQREKYLPFKNEAKTPIYPLKHVEDPCKVMKEMLSEVKLDVKIVNYEKFSYDFENRSNFYGTVKSVYNISPNMPEELKDEFYKDFLDSMETFIDQSDGGYGLNLDYLCLIAVKSE